jgi:tripeptide aminopeptidase
MQKAVNVIVKIAELTSMPNFGLDESKSKKKK